MSDAASRRISKDSVSSNSAADAAASSSRWSGRITVSCRVRPLLPHEAVTGMKRAPWVLTDRSIALGRRSTGRPSTAPPGGRELGERTLSKTVMDAVFGERSTTREVYERAFRDIVSGAAECLNGAILAYGQTASGKTHSISGSSARGLDEDISAPSQKGIIHYALEDLFKQLSEKSIAGYGIHSEGKYSVRMSYCEIYMERVNDLLRDDWAYGQHLPVKEDRESRSFYVEGLQEKVVTSAREVLILVSQAQQIRRVACTQYNEVSSRSHTLLTLTVEYSASLVAPCDDTSDVPSVSRVGRLAFVDLAGNERVEASAEYAAESNSINKSLFFLGKVIETLASFERRGSDEAVRPEFLPVRDSNLTRLLCGHLGGNSRTGLLVTLTPSQDFMEESLSTLRFAQKAATIRCNAQPAHLSKEQLFIIRQSKTITQLREELREAREQLATGMDLGNLSMPIDPQTELQHTAMSSSKGRAPGRLREECSRAREPQEPAAAAVPVEEWEPIVERKMERPSSAPSLDTQLPHRATSLGTPDFLRLARLDDVCLERPASFDLASPSVSQENSVAEPHVPSTTVRARHGFTWTPGHTSCPPPRPLPPPLHPELRVPTSLNGSRSQPSARFALAASILAPQIQAPPYAHSHARSGSPSAALRSFRSKSDVGRQRKDGSTSRLGVKKPGRRGVGGFESGGADMNEATWLAHTLSLLGQQKQDVL